MSLLPEPALAEMADGLVSTEAEEQSTPVGGTSQDGVQTVDTTQSDATEGGVGESASATAVEEAETKAITEAEPVDEAEGVALTTMADEGDLGTLADGDAVAKIGDALYATLKEALEAASAGDTITLLVDIDLTNSSKYGTGTRIPIDKSVTIDGGNHTVKVARRGFGVGVGASDNIDVTFKNMTIVNEASEGRCIDTRGNLNSLTLDNDTLKASGSASQPLTIGGNQAATATITISNSTIATSDDGSTGYAIITFNPVSMTIENSTIKGWANLYLKAASSSAGSAGSKVKIQGSTLVSTNPYSGESNAFSAILVEDNNVTVDITGSTIKVDGAQNWQAIASLRPRSLTGCSITLGEGNKVALGGDYGIVSYEGSEGSVKVTAGLFSEPVPVEFCGTDEEGNQLYPIANTRSYQG